MPKFNQKSFNAHDIRFDPDDSRATYIGLNSLIGATTTASDWQIFKFTYTTTTSSNVTQIQLKSGVWDNRAAIF